MNLRNIILFAVLSISALVITTSFEVINKDDVDDLTSRIELAKAGGVPTSPTSLKMYDLIEKYSDVYNIPKYIAYNIAFKETRYQGPFHWNYVPNRTSSAGAVGPMQVMPSTAEYINGENTTTNDLRNDMELNVSTSMKLLNRLYTKYKNWAIVCGCYNTGRPIINGYAVFCSTNLDYQSNWSYLKDI
jgi:hypothetical protein